MTDRRVRRLVTVAALGLGVADLILAAGDQTRLKAGFLGMGWALSAVFGARYVLLVAGISLIVVARSLLRGKRNASRIALIAAVVSALGLHVKEADAIGLGLSAAVLVLLIITRSRFRARSDPALARGGVQLLASGLLATFLYGTAGLYLLDRNFRESTTLGESIKDALRLLVLLPTSTIEPVTRHGRWFLDSVRFAALAVLLVGLARIVATVVFHQDPTDRATVTEILQRWATTSLAHFELLDDKNWLIATDRKAFIGYKVIGTTAVALGDPIGAPESRQQALEEFTRLCDLNGWTPAFHQITPDASGLLRGAGFKVLKIGEEAIIDVQRWSVHGPGYKWLRSALRRVERAGFEIAELPKPLDDATLAQLREVSDTWVRTGGHRERTFTVGQFDPEYLQVTRIFAVRHHDTGHIVAFANVVPSYQSPDGTFDLMRFRPDAPNGVMDLLFVGLIGQFKSEGKSGMNLGLAPLANISGESLADRALRVLYEHGGKAFRYQGLRRFKDKWDPRWEDRYLGYRHDADLPKVATAVIRAGELPEPRSTWGRVRWIARTFPVSLAVGGLIIWLMTVTAIDRDSYVGFKRHFGLGWHDLVRLHLWRLPTSQLIQTRAGYVWANVALCLVSLPIAEWVVKSRRTIVTFFIGDWVSTIPVLIGVRLAAAAGSASALDVIGHRDSGPSAGAWALVATVAMSLDNRVARRACTTATFAFLIGALIINRRLFDVQHLVSVIAVTSFWWAARRRACRNEAKGKTVLKS